MTPKFTLSLIIPCYNEVVTIEDCVELVRVVGAGRDLFANRGTTGVVI